MPLKNKRKSATVEKKEFELRNSIWPNLAEDRLWHRKRNSGFTSIPRTMPLVLKIMNELSKNKPIGNTYLDLWCQSWWDHSFITITDRETRAFYSGFSGQRAVDTWKDRMRRLEEYGFITTKEGASGQYNYVLIWNPHIVIKKLHEIKISGLFEGSYNALLHRLNEIGDKIPM